MTIGNDIADLACSENRKSFERKGWKEKTFHKNEINWIHQQHDPYKAMWSLWTCKEAAYKSWMKYCGEVFVNPKRIQIYPQGDIKESSYVQATASIEGSDHHFKLLCELNDRYVHTISNLPDDESHRTKVFQHQEHFISNKAWRRQRVLEFAGGLIANNLEILKFEKAKSGIPVLKIITDEGSGIIDLSLSDDGRFFGVVMSRNGE